MKPNAGGLRAVKIERLNGLFDIETQLFPRVALSEDTLVQTLGTKAAVRFLDDFEHNFVHTLNLSDREALSKLPILAPLTRGACAR